MRKRLRVRAVPLGAGLACAVLCGAVAATAAARAEDSPKVPQLWLDHAVSTCEHVVLGTHVKGSVTAEAELQGQLPARTVFAGGLEVEKAALAPGARRLGGRAIFFLQDRSLAPGEDRRQLMGWQAAEGVAWIESETVLVYRPAPGDPDHEAPVAVPLGEFLAALGRSLERERGLEDAVAIVESASRLERLAAIALSPRDGPPEVVAELGVDPFARRALAEIPTCGPEAFEKLQEIRSRAPASWIKSSAIRLLGTVRGLGARAGRALEAIAQDEKAPEDEVVAAIDSLFSVEDASLEILERLSHDERPRVRASVAMTLCEKVKDLTILERLTHDPDANVRERALVAARGAAIRLGIPGK